MAADEKQLFNGLKLTLSGDIFLGESINENADGYGVLLTNRNELIEGRFKQGVIESGKMRVLYSN